MSDNDKATEEYLASVQARPDAPDVDPEEEGEDIEAFLAGLEDSAQAPASEPSKDAEPDPFADAFASLEASGDSLDDDAVAAAVYQLPRASYGDVATRAESELYGAALLGLEVDDYYARLCAIADSLA